MFKRLFFITTFWVFAVVMWFVINNYYKLYEKIPFLSLLYLLIFMFVVPSVISFVAIKYGDFSDFINSFKAIVISACSIIIINLSNYIGWGSWEGMLIQHDNETVMIMKYILNINFGILFAFIFLRILITILNNCRKNKISEENRDK